MMESSENPARRKMTRAEMRREYYRLRDERGARLRAATERLLAGVDADRSLSEQTQRQGEAGDI